MTELRRVRRAECSVAAFGATAFLLALVFVLDAVRFHHDVLLNALGALRHGEFQGQGLLLVALALFDLVAFSRAVYSLSRTAGAHRRIAAGLPVREEIEIAGRHVGVIASPRPMAFCAGLLRPRVLVSQGALERLSADQLAAVVAHEAHHAARRDPLRLLVARAIGDAFVPSLSRRERALSELAADAAAVCGPGGSRSLAGALLVFDDEGGISPERVDRLCGEPPPSEVSRGVVIGAGAVVGLLLAALAWAVFIPGHPRFCLPLASAPAWTLLAVTGRVAVMAPAWLAWRRAAAYLRPTAPSSTASA